MRQKCRSPFKSILMAGPLGLAIIMTFIAYSFPTNLYWNRDPSASPHMEKVRFGWTEHRSDDITDINLDGWEMYSTGLGDGKFWCLQTLFFDGDGGRHSDAECNAFEDTHDPFIHTFLGIEIYRRWHSGITTTGFICPMWIPVLLTIIPTVFLFHKNLFAKSRTGFCPRCSYDIRATPTRCPECGTDLPTPVQL